MSAPTERLRNFGFLIGDIGRLYTKLFEYEAEVETDETEGLADARAAGEEASAAEGEGDGQRRKRRRRRRGRGGANEARDGAPHRLEGSAERGGHRGR